MSEIVLMGDERVAAIHVQECADPLVDASNIPELDWADDADDPEGTYRYLRTGLVDRLLVAQRLLPSDRRLLLVEGYRPYARQAFYFDRHRAGLQAADPGLTAQESFLAASRFVSPPQVAPRVSGAAIDLTLIDDSGVALDLGTPIDASPEESAGACYFAAPNIGDEA